MTLRTYHSAQEFLADAQQFLEREEALNNLILGICFRLVQTPESVETTPYFVTVSDRGRVTSAAVMTPPRPLLLYGDAGDVQVIARDLLDHHWNPDSIMGPTNIAKSFAETWTAMAGVALTGTEHQGLYTLTRVTFPEVCRGQLRPAREDDLELAARWLRAFAKEALREEEDAVEYVKRARTAIEAQDLYVWEDGAPVSMAAKARPLANGIIVNRVYTPPEYRNRGYASACVAHLSQHLLDSGWKFCALFTDMNNATSNHIYQEIGYTPVCDFDKYTFEGPS